MRLEHLLSGVCILKTKPRLTLRQNYAKETVREVTILDYSVSEDYDMMIKEKS